MRALQGTTLAERVYADVAMRYARTSTFSSPATWPAARTFCSARDGGLAGAHRPPRPAPGGGVRAAARTPGDRPFLELHWRTGPRFARASFPAEPLIARRRRAAGPADPCLGDDDHFLVPIVHGATHRWDRLELVCTAAEFIAQERRRLAAAAAAGGRWTAGAGCSSPPRSRAVSPASRCPPVAAALAAGRGAERAAPAAARRLRAGPGPPGAWGRVPGLAGRRPRSNPAARARHFAASYPAVATSTGSPTSRLRAPTTLSARAAGGRYAQGCPWLSGTQRPAQRPSPGAHPAPRVEHRAGLDAGTIALAVVQGVLPLAGLYMIKLIVDAVTDGLAAVDKAAAFQDVAWLILIAGLIGISALARSVSTLVSEAQGQVVTDHISDLIHSQSIAVDLEYYENSQLLRRLARAQQGLRTGRRRSSTTS